MSLSLLHIRKRLTPLAWLLVISVLVPAGAHFARGVVLCIGENHIEIESAASGHHSEPSNEIAAVDGSLTNVAPIFQEVSEQGDKPCLDVPLRLVESVDTCHQAISKEAPSVEIFSLDLTAAAFLEIGPPPDAADVRPRPAPLADLSHASSLSTIVLLI